MLREIRVIEMDLSNFMDEEEMRLTEAQWAQLDVILIKVQNLEEQLVARRRASV